jgi:hypothetical protein
MEAIISAVFDLVKLAVVSAGLNALPVGQVVRGGLWVTYLFLPNSARSKISELVKMAFSSARRRVGDAMINKQLKQLTDAIAAARDEEFLDAVNAAWAEYNSSLLTSIVSLMVHIRSFHHFSDFKVYNFFFLLMNFSFS